MIIFFTTVFPLCSSLPQATCNILLQVFSPLVYMFKTVLLHSNTRTSLSPLPFSLIAITFNLQFSCLMSCPGCFHLLSKKPQVGTMLNASAIIGTRRTVKPPPMVLRILCAGEVHLCDPFVVECLVKEPLNSKRFQAI